MAKQVLNYLLLSLSALLLFSCKNQEVKIFRAFYYWKSSEYSLKDKELNRLKDNNIQKLYVKFFEVDSDPVTGFIPRSKTELHIWNYESYKENDSLLSKTLENLEIIPTVFIRNKILLAASSGSLDTLADNMLFLIQKYYKPQIRNTGQDFGEIQIDCDWTEQTKSNYFYLLSKIKSISGKTISCTLRLYQYKYKEKAGVPPVDKAVLMCYNLLSPLASEDKNSILSNQELKKYLMNSKPYPLHLDIALPLFSWMQVYQNNQFAGIINPGKNDLDNFIKPLKPLWYEVTKDKEYENLYLRTGDKLKSEEVTASIVRESISLLNKYLPPDKSRTVILFHLDENTLNNFDNETINSFFTGINR